MTIKDLFETIENSNIVNNLKGEINLSKNHIIWSYDLTDTEDEYDEYEDEYEGSSTYELLQEAYEADYDLIESFIDINDDINMWEIGEAKLGNSNISFKIKSI